MDYELQEREEPRFEIFIENTAPVPAPQIATLLTTLNAAFRQFSRRVGRRDVTLAVASVEQGSIRIFLDAIEGAQKVWEARELLTPFATHLIEATQILLGLRSGRVSATDKKAIEAISQPVASGSATQVNLVNNGTIHLHVDERMADALLRVLRPPVQERVDDFIEREQPAKAPMLSQQEVHALETDGLEGAAVSVDGDWYARLHGGHGVLVPIKADSNVTASLQHRALYRLRGAVLQGPLGETVGIYVTEAQQIGGP
ncbi:hypothetical protein KHP60_09895 [Microvirga sp. 3-52]|uniref:hypothetical protein n=1 Tax=Microvirga sp. 3-52 TaxID=2792425 RepID=UPI001AC63312|nr:hypothetical protein [Microvirga sp. 3-52]MBO1905628.1 hypothetical protein [Microvirga sp. 3-52]MBS7452646.1 hypothetical protein [Microvirga sp. 3-52]